MKIHDKFVIELREVIKGYGNDPTVQDLCKFPCDYKFYEISGVAICEESFKKMKPLNGEIDNVLNKITSELKSVKEKWWYGVEDDCFMKLLDVLDIIDKYKTESEVAEE